MAKKSLFFLILIFALIISGKEKEHQEIKDFLERVEKFQEGIKTVKVNFTQTNDFAMLKDKEVLKGTIYIKKPSKVLYIYEKPEKLYYLAKDGELLIYNPKTKEASYHNVERYQKKIMKYLGASIPIKELEKKFDSEMVDENDRVCLIFKPKKKSLSKKMSKLVFYVDKKELTINKIVIVEPEGDSVTFEFEKWEINGEVDDKIFDINIPKGVKIKRRMIEEKK